jgi:integrase
VTSAQLADTPEDRLETIAIEDPRAWRLSAPKLPIRPSGTGDLLSSLFVAALMNGSDTPGALEDAPQFVAELSSAAGTAAKALRFLIFTVGRTNEVLGARWSEIDSTRAIWRIPGERMKMGETHSVPLSDAALAVLDEMRNGSQSDLIFPNDSDEHFSNMAMLAVLKRMNYGHVTVHGFRATFATWAEECTDYPDGVREAALAHKYKNETMAAYQRGQKLEKRRALMNDWSKHICGELTGENRKAA